MNKVAPWIVGDKKREVLLQWLVVCENLLAICESSDDAVDVLAAEVRINGKTYTGFDALDNIRDVLEEAGVEYDIMRWEGQDEVGV